MSGVDEGGNAVEIEVTVPKNAVSVVPSPLEKKMAYEWHFSLTFKYGIYFADWQFVQ